MIKTCHCLFIAQIELPQPIFAQQKAFSDAGCVSHAPDGTRLDFGVLGSTVPQKGSFYGLPWVMGEIGAAHVGGPTIMQACATSAHCLQTDAAEIAGGAA